MNNLLQWFIDLLLIIIIMVDILYKVCLTGGRRSDSCSLSHQHPYSEKRKTRFSLNSFEFKATVCSFHHHSPLRQLLLFLIHRSWSDLIWSGLIDSKWSKRVGGRVDKTLYCSVLHPETQTQQTAAEKKKKKRESTWRDPPALRSRHAKTSDFRELLSFKVLCVELKP